MGWSWNRETFQRVPYSCYVWTTWAPSLSVASVIPCVHWMWCHLIHVWNWKKRQHGMHGFHIHTSQALSLPCWKTPKLSISTQAIWNTWNVSQYWCIAKAAIQAQSIKFEILDSIPPRKPALFQRARHALLIAAFIWKSSLVKRPVMPDPSKWGWEWNEISKIWMLYWTDLPDASHGCSVLLHCGCSVACKGNCNYHRAGIRCSSLCKCQAGCTNNDMDIWLWWLSELSQSYQPYNSFMQCYCCLHFIVISCKFM